MIGDSSKVSFITHPIGVGSKFEAKQVSSDFSHVADRDSPLEQEFGDTLYAESLPAGDSIFSPQTPSS